MCGYDPFWLLDERLELEQIAYEHGYDNYEEYRESLLDEKGNRNYDNFTEEKTLNG